MKALIDGDILLYRIGFSSESENANIALHRMDELISRILDTVQADEFEIYLSCGRTESFRAKLNPEYKANRTQPKPTHYAVLKQHLIDEWAAIQAVEEEADDLIGINLDANSIACTIDKDILYGLEGHKYDFVKEKLFYTSEEEALKFFYMQLLMGDKADNVIGIPGIGPKKAERALDGIVTELEMFFKVQEMYREWLAEEWADRDWGLFEEKQMNNLILLSGIQLKIRTEVGELWDFPILLEEEVRPVIDGMD
jgi:5'-3' exonuclease